MKKEYALVLGLLLSFVVPAKAAEPVKIADGSSSGIYQRFVKEITGVCGDVLTLSEVPSSGAIENLNKIIQNEANAGFMHSDVLFFRSKTEDLTHLKTLLALFNEDVHFVVLNRPFKGGDWRAKLSSGKNLETLADLRGLPVGAAGGGFITSQVINIQGEVGYTVRQFDSGKEVLAALDRGEIAAAEFTGPAPLPNLQTLGKEYRILPINDVIGSKLKSVYHTTSVTYTNMSPESVPTVAADSLLITREYKTPKFVNALKNFRQCVFNHLDELKETSGYHKAWQQVEASNHGKWDWYNFGQTTK